MNLNRIAWFNQYNSEYYLLETISWIYCSTSDMMEGIHVGNGIHIHTHITLMEQPYELNGNLLGVINNNNTKNSRNDKATTTTTTSKHSSRTYKLYVLYLDWVYNYSFWITSPTNQFIHISMWCGLDVECSLFHLKWTFLTAWIITQTLTWHELLYASASHMIGPRWVKINVFF